MDEMLTFNWSPSTQKFYEWHGPTIQNEKFAQNASLGPRSTRLVY